ncbi:THUMP domain-containing protein 1 [Frankliniella fusca]|uniref:THUMP domain-containing protein 1 n=1 Tax=Frankliniella fusca TaxID=407009 RepID=A0AAE1L6K7_9NEOP|nr:THUMP domain-containing protein 1 [Frankliniella fusca]
MAEVNKRKKSAYYSKCAAKKGKFDFSLHPGVRGFIATCNFREKECIRETINILSEFADMIYGEDKAMLEDNQPKNKKIVFKDSESETEEDNEDIEAALAREVNVLKQERQNRPSQRRFQVVQSGADNCLFIRSTVEDPVLLVETILKDIEAKSKQRTRFLMRLLPIEVTCKAWPDDIKVASGKLLDKYFKGEPKTFCVVFKRRNNSNVVREELIQDLASDIKARNPLHRADMKQPELTVIVEVIRNVCCMAVVPKYFHYRKYNLLEVAKSKTAQDPNPESSITGENISVEPTSSPGVQSELDLKTEDESSDKIPSIQSNGQIKNVSEIHGLPSQESSDQGKDNDSNTDGEGIEKRQAEGNIASEKS